MVKSNYDEYQSKMISESEPAFLGKTLEQAQLDNPKITIHVSGPMTYEYREDRISVDVVDDIITKIRSIG